MLEWADLLLMGSLAVGCQDSSNWLSGIGHLVVLRCLALRWFQVSGYFPVFRFVVFGYLVGRIPVFGRLRLFGSRASGISGVGFQGFGCLVVFGCFVSSSSGIWLAGFGYLAVRNRVFGCPPLFGSKVVLGIWLLSDVSFRRLRYWVGRIPVFGCQESGIWLSGIGYLVVPRCLVLRWF